MAAKTFRAICEQMIATHEAKNTDYGDSWKLAMQLLGIPASQGIMVRMTDKMQRACNLMRKGNENRAVADEKLEDTLIDLAVYSILCVLRLQEEAGTPFPVPSVGNPHDVVLLEGQPT